MRSLATTVSLLALVAAGAAHAGIIDETAHAAPGAMAPGAAGPAAADNRPMRTSVSLGTVQAAFNDSDPRANVRVFRYSRDMTYKIRQREFADTTVVLPKGESIAGFTLPDNENFTFIPYAGKDQTKADPDGLENVFTVRPKHPGGDTNLTIIGRSGRLYPFYLRVDSVKSEHMPMFVVYIEDGPDEVTRPGAAAVSHAKPIDGAKPEPTPARGAKPKMTGEEAAAEAEYLRSLPEVDPSKINLDGYRVAGGDKALAPVKVFDNGYWTYFQLSKEGNLDKARVPAIYRVVDGYDTPVNTRIEGGTIIAETTSKGWTLRSGEAHLCIRAK